METLTQTQVAITPATTDDIPVIITLARRIWPTTFKVIMTPTQIDNMLSRIYSLENLRQEMAESHRFWLARDDDRPVGYVSAYKQETAIWIKKLYVDLDKQNKGIGARLMKAAVESFMPVAEIKLYVNRDNIAAQRFYEHIGFRLIGEEPVQMGDYHLVDFVFSKPIK